MKKIIRIHLMCLAFAAISLLSGCTSTSYVTPSGRADLAGITSSTMQESFAARPAAGIPASVATVRIQMPGYRNYRTDQDGGTYGSGRYSVILVKEVEDAADIQRLSKLPDLGGIISLSRLLLPPKLQSDRDLREAAAKLKADMLLMYTFDTRFYENNTSGALRTVTLGIAPTRKVTVNVTASALIIDTRTGFIYGALEASEKREVRTSSWASSDSADLARREAEKAAFKQLVDEFEKSWPRFVERAKKGA